MNKLIRTDGFGMPDQKTTIGKNPDGSVFIDIRGPKSARANLTPKVAFDAAVAILAHIGYRLDLGSGPQ